MRKSTMTGLLAVACGMGGMAQSAAAACYVVYDKTDRVVYREQTPPVDLSYQLHQTLPSRVPGGRMVFALDGYGCDRPVNELVAKNTASAPNALPDSLGGRLRQSGHE